VAKKDPTRDKLSRLRDLATAAPPSLAADLRPFLQDKVGLVVASAARVAAEHGLRPLVPVLEEAFTRLLVDPVKYDPGCRGKHALAEALRQLDAPSHQVYTRGIICKQPEPTFGPPIDTAAPLRVCCAAALLETRYPFALLEAAALLMDPEANARCGVAAVLGNAAQEGAEAVLRLKVLAGDVEPDVVGACMGALLRAAFTRSLPFVLRAVTSASDDVVEQALLALGESRDERAIAPLRDHTDDDRPDVRAAALLGLSLARLPSADEFLISLVESAPDRGVKEVLRALKPRLHDDALVGRLQVALGARSESLRRLLEEGLAGSRQGSPLQGTTERAR
jgi:hypothetical protein